MYKDYGFKSYQKWALDDIAGLSHDEQIELSIRAEETQNELEADFELNTLEMETLNNGSTRHEECPDAQLALRRRQFALEDWQQWAAWHIQEMEQIQRIVAVLNWHRKRVENGAENLRTQKNERTS